MHDASNQIGLPGIAYIQQRLTGVALACSGTSAAPVAGLHIR
jgi:hypothetical protein